MLRGDLTRRSTIRASTKPDADTRSAYRTTKLGGAGAGLGTVSIGRASSHTSVSTGVDHGETTGPE